MEKSNIGIRRKNVIYPESYKKMVCQEYVETGVTKASINRKYNIAGADSIGTWLRKFGFDKYTSKEYGRMHAEINQAMNKKEEESIEALKKKIKALERDLEDARLRESAANLIIDIAEKQLNIPIRKKSNTK